MKILVFGGTGLIGKAILSHAEMEKHEVIVISRRYHVQDKKGHINYSDYDRKSLKKLFQGNYGIINLAGAGIGDRLWTKKRKGVLLQSRLFVTRLISDLVNSTDSKPAFIIQASAVGYYGDRGEDVLDEHAHKGIGFLSEITGQWEDALMLTRSAPTRKIFIRSGLVLSNKGGLLKRLVLPFRMFVGGHLGHGQQWMPWIHIEDEIGAILFLIENKEANGVFNLVSPNPVRMKTFYNLLGKSINRPSWFHIPAGLIRTIPGGFGKELLLSSQKVSPGNLLKLKYNFSYPTLDQALQNIFHNE